MRRKDTYTHERLWSCVITCIVDGQTKIVKFSLWARGQKEAIQKATLEANDWVDEVIECKVSVIL